MLGERDMECIALTSFSGAEFALCIKGATCVSHYLGPDSGRSRHSTHPKVATSCEFSLLHDTVVPFGEHLDAPTTEVRLERELLLC